MKILKYQISSPVLFMKRGGKEGGWVGREGVERKGAGEVGGGRKSI